MAETERLDPADVNARDAWRIEDKIRGPEDGSNEAPSSNPREDQDDPAGRDVPPSRRPDQDSPWLGGG